jgi:hypothetical protein
MPKPRHNIYIPLTPDEALAGLMAVKPAGAHRQKAQIGSEYHRVV